MSERFSSDHRAQPPLLPSLADNLREMSLLSVPVPPWQLAISCIDKLPIPPQRRAEHHLVSVGYLLLVANRAEILEARAICKQRVGLAREQDPHFHPILDRLVRTIHQRNDAERPYFRQESTRRYDMYSAAYIVSKQPYPDEALAICRTLTQQGMGQQASEMQWDATQNRLLHVVYGQRYQAFLAQRQRHS